ncbi:MAG: ATP-binding protein [bacterium]
MTTLSQTNLVVAIGLTFIAFFASPLITRFRPTLCYRPSSASLSFLAFASLSLLPVFALVQLTGRFGMAVVLVLIVFSLMEMLAPILFAPIQWFTRRRRLRGFVDIMVYRFRGRRFGQLLCACLLLSTLPFLLAHIVALRQILNFGFDLDGLNVWVICTLMMGAAWLFLLPVARQGNLAGQQIGTFVLSTVVILSILIGGGLLNISKVFGDLEGMNRWVVENQQFRTAFRSENISAILAMFFGASLVFPQFHEIRTREKSLNFLKTTAWFFPLLLLVSALPMFPLMWSGIEVEAEIPLQLYGVLLATVLDSPALATITVTGGLLAILSGLSLAVITLTRPIINYIAIPADPDFSRHGLAPWLSRKNALVYALLLGLPLLVAPLLRSSSISDLLLVSFAGLTQLAPGILITFYFPGINRRGMAAGLIAGMSFWFLTLFLPLFLGGLVRLDLPFGLSMSFGMPHLSALFYEALLLNIFVCTLVSKLSPMGDSERRYAEECMVDTLPELYRPTFAPFDPESLQNKLSGIIGKDCADALMTNIRAGLETDNCKANASICRALRDRLAAELNSRVGTEASYRIMQTVLPVVASEKIQENFLAIEHDLDRVHDQLSGLSAELNKLRLYHRRSLEQLPIGVCTLDSGGEIIFWNKAMEAFTHIERSIALGSTVAGLPVPWNQVIGEFIDSGTQLLHALEVNHREKPAWCTLRQTHLDDSAEKGNSRVVLLEDVSEATLLGRGLAHSERLASVGRLAAGIAHEIGNPVTGIACLAQDILSESEQHGGLFRDDANMIIDQTRRITRIVRSLTDFSRSGTHDKTRFNSLHISEPVADALTLINLKNDRNIKFLNHVDVKALVLGDYHQLTQVFLNLLSNAYEESPDGGQVTVRSATCDGNILIDVEDQGCGILEEHQDLIFEPFFTTKDVGEGTGLGLSIVHQIIKNHGGTISVQRRDTGACMRITLPLAPP